ncbi:MAG TPA: pyruvate dehydrogenase complex dihydrolipoamide acetyltransferase [Alkalispirochaeta sp.]|nr:pyruvate dehydrogenase complex dihydrolipoamide acetyltransferase [Alkalispirochaeta sp.]
MAEKVPMTALSPTMEEGTISGWSKKEGDEISAGDVICEVETDKASMDYEATQEGTLLKIIVGEGGQAKVGQTIAILGEKGEDTSSIEKEVAQEGEASGSEPEQSSDSGADEPQEKESSKDESPTAESAGGAQSDKTSSKEQSSSKSDSADAQPKAATAPPVERSDGSRIKASPLAVKLAAERNINLSLLSGSGPDGRIVKRDIEEFRGVPGGAGAAASASGSASTPAAEDQVIPVAGKRAVIAKRLSESKFSAPHYYVKMSVDMDSMVQARKMLNATLPEKVSLNAFFIKFVAEALKRHPNINASWQGDTIVQYGSIDIGIAVDAGNGLITPVVKNCGNRGVVDIDADLQQLITKARDGKLKPEEYTGATFTISNLGSFGVDEFTAIINPPGSAILALGATKPTPVAKPDGSLGVGNIMKMTLSCDHRVIDGAAGGRFLHDLQQMMEEPVRMIF